MKVLELFAGSRSVGKIAEELGMEVFSSDLIAFEGIHYPISILDFDVTKVPFKPDIIWASPPCTGFSVAAPRGSRTGTQGRANAYERSKIPEELCREILKSCIK